MKKSLLIILIFSWLSVALTAQVATMEPTEASVDDTVTIYFDATKGDQGLLDFEGDVYAHTGVITLESDNGGDWKHVVADWGTENDDVLMTRESENLYSLTFHIKSYYGIEDNETALELAFVFRNADGSMSARSADGSDIFVPLATPSDDYESHQMDGNSLIVNGSSHKYVLTPWNEQLIKLSVHKAAIMSDSSYVVTGDQQDITPQVEEMDDRLTFTVGDKKAIIFKSPLSIKWKLGSQILLKHNSSLINATASGGLFDFETEEQEHFYGTGSRAIPVDRRGYSVDFYNQAHYGYSNGAKNLNIAVPLIVSSKNYGLYFDNHQRSSLDIATSGNKLRYSAENGVMEYFFIFGKSQQSILENYSGLTGKQELPPLWSLGYIQSRYGYTDQEQAEEVVSQMQANDFPMDALVLDLYWFGSTNDMGDLNWDSNRFPQPVEMMKNFEDDGIKTVLITEPYFTLESDHYDYLAQNNLLATDQSGDPFVLQGFWAGDAGLLDMTKEAARNWMWQYYKDRIEEGVAGWWTDLAEPESHPPEMQHQDGNAEKVHNIYNLEWQRMLYKKHKEEYPQKRLFNLSRSGWAGMQRYNTFPWSGDIQRSFNGLQAQIPIMLGMSMSGVGYMHSDIGGFTGGGQQPELYTRWMQLGAFAPVMRAHGTDVPTEPIYYNEATQDRVRKIIKLRYDFLPYNYNLAWKYTTKGIPLARPVNFYEPGNQQLANINDEFLWGKDVLVAPVLEEDKTTKEVMFPSGKWYDYRNNDYYQGNQSYTVDAPIDDLPIFIRSGSFIIQSNKDLMTTTEYQSDSLLVKYYLGDIGNNENITYYFDDGLTRGNLENGNYELLALSSESGSEEITLSLSKDYDGSGYSEKAMEFEVNGFDSKPSRITVNQKEWDIAENEGYYNSSEKLAYWSDKSNRLHVKFPWSDTLTDITITRPDIGMEEITYTNKLFNLHSALPNPFEHSSTITLDVMNAGNYLFTMTDISGNTIQKYQRHLRKGRINFSLNKICSIQYLAAGIYFLKVEHQNNSQAIKLVKVN